jgi:hypothetical protein
MAMAFVGTRARRQETKRASNGMRNPFLLFARETKEVKLKEVLMSLYIHYRS